MFLLESIYIKILDSIGRTLVLSKLGGFYLGLHRKGTLGAYVMVNV